MTGSELVELFKAGTRRYHIVGTVENGVIVGLDLEGRLYTVIDNQVVSRVNPEAFTTITTRKGYINPGGDGLWPAPEGTKLGYEYSTNAWRVPPGLTSANYCLTQTAVNQATVEAEIDLINASGCGIPTIFRRKITVAQAENGLNVITTASIEYIGNLELKEDECLLAPWTLCQFDCAPGCEVICPAIHPEMLWDMYEPSDSERRQDNGLWHIRTDGMRRFQVGLAPDIPWIELRNPMLNLRVRRNANPLPADQHYIDIVDAPPDSLPDSKQVRYSVYCDREKFVEIEAAGGCTSRLTPGTVLELQVMDQFSHLK